MGIIVILIGVFISSTLKQTSGNILTEPNTQIDTLGLRLELRNVTVYTEMGNVHLGRRCYPEYSAIKMDVEIKQGSNVYRGAFWIYLYTAYGVVSKPLIIPTLEGDIYAHLYHTNSTYSTLVHALMGVKVILKDVVITVEKILLVQLVWIGVAMLSIGMGISLIREILETFRKH